MGIYLVLILAGGLAASVSSATVTPMLSEERVVFQLSTGDIEFGFYPEVAPKTTQHIFELVTLGGYTSNHFFRVDKGFVAQTGEVASGRSLPMGDKLKEIAGRSVPFEPKAGVSHMEGALSLAKGDAPDSGGSSFFIMLSNSLGLDMRYAVFGRVTKGMDLVHALEKLPTKTEGIFVMPLERVTILSSYWYRSGQPVPVLMGLDAGGEAAAGPCKKQLDEMRQRFDSQEEELAATRKRCS